MDLTFETLGKSRNEAAVDVLVAALDTKDTGHRQKALAALLSRSEPRAPELLLASWTKLQREDLALLVERKTWLTAAITQALSKGRDEAMVAIEAAEALDLTTVLPSLIQLAESAATRTFRLRASEAVLKIVEPLGVNARNDRDQSTVRGPVMTRLADSLRRFSMHRNEQLVEAFLVCASWSDGELRQFLAEGGSETELICRTLAESQHPSNLDLLSGFVRRRNLHPRILQVLRNRPDDAFRSGLLRAIGLDPTQIVLKNLRELGMPQCCQLGESILASLPIDCRAVLVHVHVTCNPDYIKTLHLIAATAEQGTRDCLTAATIAFTRCEIPNAPAWMRAALHLAENDPVTMQCDETARLLRRLILLLAHPDAALNRSLRRVLTTLHASEMLPHFQSLRTRSRRRLGKVVWQIDPDALDRVRDALRHPVLTKRLEAIAMADALGAVDLLYDSFAHISREDHQEARMRAAEAMAEATSEETLNLLMELIELPQCPVRDTAIEAIERRQNSPPGSASPTARVR